MDDDGKPLNEGAKRRKRSRTSTFHAGIRSGAFTRHILGVQTGIGVPHISGQQIKDFVFLMPPVEEQRSIADNFESLRNETQRLEAVYQRKLAALDELTKSLLHHAFSGQL